MVFLSRKQLLFTALFSLLGEILVNLCALLMEYMGWLDVNGERILFWVCFTILSLVIGWASWRFTHNWFVAILVPILIFVPFTLIIMSTLLFLAFVLLYIGASLGGYFLFDKIIKKARK